MIEKGECSEMTTKNRVLFIISFVSSLAFWILALIIPQYNIWQWVIPFYIAYQIYYVVNYRTPDFTDFNIMDTAGVWSTLLLVLAVKYIIKLF
jgi:hypothetical protein